MGSIADYRSIRVFCSVQDLRDLICWQVEDDGQTALLPF